MQTKMVKASAAAVETAAKIVKDGGVVAVPTETVYGLAANAYDGEAIKKIFEAKGRPQDNPLIVHIAELKTLREVAATVPAEAEMLAAAFWPGPLTMVLPKGEKVSPVTTAGLDSVGVRMPKNPWARELILKSGVPFAAPSANLSGKPSPTTAEDVFTDMNGRIPLILDGGPSDAGVESTVVSLLESVPVLLRPGAVTKEQIEAVLKKEVKIAGAVYAPLKSGEQARSPGMKYRHYAPKAEITVVKGDLNHFIRYVKSRGNTGTYCLCFEGEEEKMPFPAVCYGREGDGKDQAHKLFRALRTLDERGAVNAFCRCPQAEGVSLAVYNRLMRAAAFRIENAEE